MWFPLHDGCCACQEGFTLQDAAGFVVGKPRCALGGLYMAAIGDRLFHALHYNGEAEARYCW